MKAFFKITNTFLLLGILLLAYHLGSPDARGRAEFGDNPVNEFIRGDSNDDGLLNVSAAVFTLSFLFIGDELPECVAAADTNDDGTVNITDVIRALNYLFMGGAGAPPPPFPEPGEDPTRSSAAESPPCRGCPRPAPWEARTVTSTSSRPCPGGVGRSSSTVSSPPGKDLDPSSTETPAAVATRRTLSAAQAGWTWT